MHVCVCIYMYVSVSDCVCLVWVNYSRKLKKITAVLTYSAAIAIECISLKDK